MGDTRRKTGQIGESLALQYLQEQGYRLVQQNYRCRLGEIDLIMALPGLLVFIEVRTRRSNRFGAPEESIRQNKRKRIHRIAQYYLRIKNLYDFTIRFDVIAIVLDSVNRVERLKHIEGAF